ncbi:MAG: hypothetical protein F4X56_00890 [Gammaproteobacteria bacterium]|nr:hypothetical protein [Gammaproteobacteria bacterium]
MNTRKFAKKFITLVAVTVIAISAHLVVASGSVGGGGGPSKFGHMYTQGKAIFFKKIACDKGCLLTRKEVTSDRAKEIVSAIRSRNELSKSESEMDKVVSLLEDSEMDKVEHYLARRFKIKD